MPSAIPTSSTVSPRSSIWITACTLNRSRFVERRLNGLFDEPRPGHGRTITDDKVEAVIVKTLEDKPADAWSTRSMAKAMGMSQTWISLIWRAFGLQPHREESFKLFTDPLLLTGTGGARGFDWIGTPPVGTLATNR